MYTFEDLVNITNKLRSEKGCSWDREQTYESLKKCLEEESREVLNA
ncbi:MAG: nucleotide pyrophosphohydrolase, partial [Lacrimispora sphenoides]